MKKQPIPFGKYCLLARLHVGETTEVWRAMTLAFERRAIKRLPPAGDEERITRFIDEAKIGAQLEHALRTRTLPRLQHRDAVGAREDRGNLRSAHPGFRRSRAVDDAENLTTAMAGKIWQKIAILKDRSSASRA